MSKQNDIREGTKAVWAGEKESLAYNATQVPVVLSVAYNYDDIEEWHEVAIGNKQGYIYNRMANPTVQALEEKVRISRELKQQLVSHQEWRLLAALYIHF